MKFKRILALSLGLGLLTNSGFQNQAQAAVTPEADPLNPYANFLWYYPTNTSDITSPYGWRTINGTREFHKGFDLGAFLAPARSVDAGKVLSAGTYSGDGAKYVTIQTNDKDPDTSKLLIVRYIHLDSSSVSTGASVTRGQQIGVTGNTGGVGYHLHFDVNNGGATSGTSMNESNTINPIHFWPSRSWSSPPADLTVSSSTAEETGLHVEEEHNHSHHNYYNDEYFFEDTLINHVGEESFNQWLFALPMEERTLTNFKKHFNITDKQEREIKVKPWKKK